MDSLGSTFEIENAAVTFGETRALDGVSLSVGAGESLALIGPSGAGKTTLLRLLNATVRPTSGRVAVNGRDLATFGAAETRALRGRVAFIHQDYRLLPNLRVSQNVLAGRLGQMSYLKSIGAMLRPSKTSLNEVYALLERVGIPEKIFERTDSLSGGQRQRVAIARGLYQQPRALLADEPVASVDPARARDTVELLTRIAREENLTLCMSLHNIELAREFFPRLVGIRRGQLAFDKANGEVSDQELSGLYQLDQNEMLVDGA
ncbi:MAG: ATP-binding cassette domain-containing protein [Planctomycetota bacterium]